MFRKADPCAPRSRAGFHQADGQRRQHVRPGLRYDQMSPLADDFGDPRAFIAGSPIQTGSLYWADKIAPYVKNGGDSGLSTGRGTDNYGAARTSPAGLTGTLSGSARVKIFVAWSVARAKCRPRHEASARAVSAHQPFVLRLGAGRAAEEEPRVPARGNRRYGAQSRVRALPRFGREGAARSGAATAGVLVRRLSQLRSRLAGAPDRLDARAWSWWAYVDISRPAPQDLRHHRRR